VTDRLSFLNALAALLSKGCTVREALELLREDGGDKAVARAAALVLDGLNKGSHLAEIFAGTPLPGGTAVAPYIGLLSRTGSILPALTLALADGKRKRDTASGLTEALLYPVCVTGLLAILLALLFAEGIPWMSRAGLLHDKAVIAGMHRGVAGATAFLAVSTGTAACFAGRLLAEKNREYRFWSLLDCLADAGLTFDEALGLCAGAVPLPCTLDDSGYFFDAPELDLFTRTTLRTMRLTGDWQSAFASIAARKKEALDSLYAVLAKTAEPLLLAITGIVILILALTVFLPVLTANGGFA